MTHCTEHSGSCEHAETTVLLYLFGEAPPEYSEHLDGCAECQAALSEHADTVAWVSPALTQPPAAELVQLTQPTTPRSWLVGAGLALAAGMALSLQPGPSVDIDDAPVMAELMDDADDAEEAAPDLSWEEPFSTKLSSLDAEINHLARDLETSK